VALVGLWAPILDRGWLACGRPSQAPGGTIAAWVGLVAAVPFERRDRHRTRTFFVAANGILGERSEDATRRGCAGGCGPGMFHACGKFCWAKKTNEYSWDGECVEEGRGMEQVTGWRGLADGRTNGKPVVAPGYQHKARMEGNPDRVEFQDRVPPTGATRRAQGGTCRLGIGRARENKS